MKKKYSKVNNGKCIECAHAKLYRYKPENPVIACCMLSKSRQVASSNPHCGMFKQTTKENLITNLFLC